MSGSITTQHFDPCSPVFGVGKLSPADVELLLSRVVPPCGKDPIQLAVHTYMELEKQGCKPVILLPTLKRCQEVNDEMMKRFTTEVVCKAEDVIDQQASSIRVTKKVSDRAHAALDKVADDTSRTAGLPTCVHLAIGC